MDKARDHELKLFHLLQSSKRNVNNAFCAYNLRNKELVAFTTDRVDFVAVKHLVVECCNHCTINATNRFNMYYKLSFSSSSIQVL